MGNASKDYFNSRNTSTKTETFSAGVTKEKADQAKQKIKQIGTNVKNRTEEDVKDAKKWWDSRR